MGRFAGCNTLHWGAMFSPLWPHPCTAGHRHRPKTRVCSTPPLGIPQGTVQCSALLGAGGYNGIVDTLAIHLHIDTRHLVSSLMAAVPPSVSGMTSGHHMMSFSPRLSLQASSHVIICHKGPRHVPTGELLIIICLLVSWKGLSPSESSL